MEILINLFNILLPVLYATSLLLYGLHFFRSDRRASAYMSKVLVFTVVIHLAEVILRGIYFNYFPSANIYQMTSVLALAITLIYLYIEHRIKIKTTGFFILISAFLLQLFSTVFISFEKDFPEILRSPMFIFHTATAILGYAALFVSALYAIMYLMLFHNLKSAQFGIIYRKMSSLEELSEMNIRSTILGFLLLTATIFLGIMWRKTALPNVNHFDPQVIAAYLIWVIYGLVIYGKKIGGWTGKSLAYISIGGFAVIIISAFVIRMFIKSFHQFG